MKKISIVCAVFYSMQLAAAAMNAGGGYDHDKSFIQMLLELGTTELMDDELAKVPRQLKEIQKDLNELSTKKNHAQSLQEYNKILALEKKLLKKRKVIMDVKQCEACITG